jgi:hypothetical protein
MTSLVLLVEEASMEALLEGVLPRVVPQGMDVQIIAHEGKTDLKQSIPRKLRGWGVPGARFVVLIDQDANDCRKLKNDIVRLCREAGREDVLVRIVCRSLESWVLGDLEALGRALARPAIAKKQSVKKLRAPDKLGDPLRELRALVGEYQKVSGARRVAAHLSLEAGTNTSASFRAFLDGLARLVGEAPRR